MNDTPLSPNSAARIAVITAECGGESVARDPSVWDASADYFLFTDAPAQEYEVWTRVPLTPFSDDGRYANRRNAKVYKILASLVAPGYDYYIWHDASHDMMVTPGELVALSQVDEAHPFGVFRHGRGCVYREAALVMRKGLDHAGVVRRQLKQYRAEGYPDRAGLYELPVIVRKAGPVCQQIELMWWEQICRYSSRDQLSFPYVLWKLGVEPRIMPGSAMKNQWVTRKWRNGFHRKSMHVPMRWRVYNWFRYKGRAAVRLCAGKR